MKIQLRRGVVLLSAAAAAALAACNGGETAGDGDAGDGDGDMGDGDTGDGDGDTGGSTGDGDGDGDTGGTSGDGDGDLGGMGGDTASGGAPGSGGMGTGGVPGAGGNMGMTESLTPEEACPLPLFLYWDYGPSGAYSSYPAGDYAFFERVGSSEFGDALSVGTSDSERLGYRVQNGSSCIVAADGDDIIELEFYQYNNAHVAVSGGLGADALAISYRGVSPYGGSNQVVQIVDFEPGIDTLYIDNLGIEKSNATLPNLVFVDTFAVEEAVTVASERSIIVERSTGYIWLATSSEGGAADQIGLIANAEDLTASDIVIGSSAPGCPYTPGGHALSDLRNSAGEVVASYLTAAESTALSNYIHLFPDTGAAMKTSAGESGYCIAGNSGDDTIQLFSSGAQTFNGAYVSGGLGEDAFVFNFPFTNEPSGQHMTVTIGDFTTGVDKLVFGGENFGLSGIEAVSISSTDVTSESTFVGVQVIIDATDGQIWYTPGNTIGQNIGLLFEAPTIVIEDIIVVPPPL